MMMTLTRKYSIDSRGASYTFTNPENLLSVTELREYYQKNPTWIPELCRRGVSWWIRWIFFPFQECWTTQQLEEWIAQGEDVLILDSRRKDECEISHIKGAVHLHFSITSVDFSKMKEVPRDKIIVAYCAIGLRSSLLCAALQKNGFKNARPLLGGFYGWVNDGRPIYSGDVLTYQVKPQHVFASWALKEGVKHKKSKKQKQKHTK